MSHPSGGKGKIYFLCQFLRVDSAPAWPISFSFFRSQNDLAHQECNFRITVISPAPGDRQAGTSESAKCQRLLPHSGELVTWWNHQLHCLPAPSLWDILKQKTQVFLICFFRSALRIILVMKLLVSVCVPHSLEILFCSSKYLRRRNIKSLQSVFSHLLTIVSQEKLWG